MTLSKDTLKDPTRADWIRRDYEEALVRAMEKYRDRILAALPKAMTHMAVPTPFDLDFFSQMMNDIGVDILDMTRKDIEKYITKSFIQGVKFGDMTAGEMIGQDLGAFYLPPYQPVIDALVSRNAGAFKGVTDETQKQIMAELSDGVLNGEGMYKLGERINDRVDSIGIVRAQTIARTETMSAVNTGTLSRYSDIGIERVKWLAAADDGRLCDFCALNDGTVYTIDAAMGMLPVHPNCRCCFVPYLEALENMIRTPAWAERMVHLVNTMGANRALC